MNYGPAYSKTNDWMMKGTSDSNEEKDKEGEAKDELEEEERP